LLKHEFLAQATVMAELIDLAHLEAASFADRLGAEEYWAAGSVADIVDLRRSLEPLDPDTRRDSLELIQTPIRLADPMRTQGSHRRDPNSWGNGFRRSLEGGVREQMTFLGIATAAEDLSRP
jgi:hypothetical protein